MVDYSPTTGISPNLMWLAILGTATVAIGVSTLVVTKVLVQPPPQADKHTTNNTDRLPPKEPTDLSCFEQLIGNTPLLYIKSLSEVTQCHIYAKAEFLNPGGSVKDRVALQMVLEAEKDGLLKSGYTIYEGSAGSTGISLAMIAKARGYGCHIFMPDDQAMEKSDLLKALGSKVDRVRPVSYSNPEHFCHLARKYAESDPVGGLFANQFDNLANYRAHFEHTGPEIWEQTNGKLHAFVAAAGTGGTLSGISNYLKQCNPKVKSFLIDPQGSALYNKVKNGVLYASQDREGHRKKHQVDSITEGIGINNRLTKNFSEGKIDNAFQATDMEAMEMSRYLMANEGLFIGSSSAVNCIGAVKASRHLGPGHTIVTVLCDSGHRHLTKFWNDEVLKDKYGLSLDPSHQPRARDDLSFIL